MNNKQELLAAVKQGLQSGTITKQDLGDLLPGSRSVGKAVLQHGVEPNYAATGTRTDPSTETSSVSLSANEVLLYVGGLIVFGSQIAMIVQYWEPLGSIGRVVLTAGIAVVLWILSIFMLKKYPNNKNVTSITDSALLVGCLGFALGLTLAVSQIAGDSDSVRSGAWIIAIASWASMTAYLVMDKIVRKDITIIFTLFAMLAAFYAAMSGVLGENDFPEVWGLVALAGAGLLYAVSQLLVRLQPDRIRLKAPLLSVVGYLVFSTVYWLCIFGDVAVLWQLIMPFLLTGAFALSAKLQIKNFLVTGSIFLFLYILFIATHYFAGGAGTPIALFVGGIGVIAAGVFINKFNHKYLK